MQADWVAGGSDFERFGAVRLAVDLRSPEVGAASHLPPNARFAPDLARFRYNHSSVFIRRNVRVGLVPEPLQPKPLIFSLMHSSSSSSHLRPPPRPLGQQVMIAFVIGYLLLFFSQADHRSWLLLPLIPDLIVERWFGGAWEHVAVVDRLPILATVLLLSAIALTLGNGLVRSMRLTDITRIEECVYSLGAGFSAMSLYTLFMGLAGQLRSRGLMMGPLVLAALAVGYFVRRRSIASESSVAELSVAELSVAKSRGPSNPETAKDDGQPLAIRGWCGIAFCLALILIAGSLLPPWEFDVLEYHLQVPKEWLKTGRIEFLPHNVYGNMPLGAEMLPLLSMVAIGGDDGWWWGAIAGKVVFAGFSLLTAALLHSLGRRLFSSAAGAIAAVVYLGIPWVSHVSVTGLIDGVVAFYVVATVSLLVAWQTRQPQEIHEGNGDRGLLLAGWMAGSAAAAKYPPLILVVLPVLIWIVVTSVRESRRGVSLGIKRGVIFLVMALAVSGPWYAKNGFVSGNPVYPLAYRWFGGLTRTDAKDQQWRDAHRDRDAEGRSYSWPQLSRSITRVFYRSEWLSPILIPLAAVGLFASHGRTVRSIGLLIAIYLSLWWLLTHRIDRFWIPVMPLLALFAGAGATWGDGRWWRPLVAGAVVLSSLLTMVVSSAEQPGVIRDTQFFVGLQELRRQYSHPVHRWLNERYASDLSRDGASSMRVLLVGDAQPFGLDPPVTYSTCFDDCWLETLLRGRSRSERLQALQSAGITHVFVYWREIARYRATYGYSDFVTPEFVHRELVREQKLLRAVPIEFDPQAGELFTVSAE